jgi:hypothetical protein
MTYHVESTKTSSIINDRRTDYPRRRRATVVGKKKTCDLTRGRTWNLLIERIVVKRLAIGPLGRRC